MILSFAVDATTISLVALVISILAFVFGSGAPLQLIRWSRQCKSNHKAIDSEIDQYLYHAVMFSDGLPFFIQSTWNWGMNVPNYAAAGSFPADTPAVNEVFPELCPIVRQLVEFYCRHSSSRGRVFDSLDETLEELSRLQKQFWATLELLAKRRWPFRWRSKMEYWKSLQIPSEEHDRIGKLKENRIS